MTYNRREQIIIAAQHLFSEHGYNSLTLNLIINKVGITRPTFYKYFSNKEEVLLHVLVKFMEDWLNTFKCQFKLNIQYEYLDISRRFTTSVQDFPEMFELYQISFYLLEPRASSKEIAKYKDNVNSILNSCLLFFKQLFPLSSSHHIQESMLFLWGSISGIYMLKNIYIEDSDSLMTSSSLAVSKEKYNKMILAVVNNSFKLLTDNHYS